MKTCDWENWIPKERSVLCYVLDVHQVLLIHKKRGFGAGKVSAPGGRIESGETPLAAAVRETQEEVGITPSHPVERGQLAFQFQNGHSIHCIVFLARRFTGRLIETDEAKPIWTDRNKIPYSLMWQDDAVWLPGVLKGRGFRASFTFNEERMQDYAIEWE